MGTSTSSPRTSDSDNVSVISVTVKSGFSPASGSPFPAGQNPSDIAVADFNGDDSLDIAVSNHGVKTRNCAAGLTARTICIGAGSPFNVESSPHPHGIRPRFSMATRSRTLPLIVGENKSTRDLGNGDGAFQTPGMKFEAGNALPSPARGRYERGAMQTS